MKKEIIDLSQEVISLYREYKKLSRQAASDKAENDEILSKILQKYNFKVDFSEADEQFKEELAELSPEEILEIRSHVIKDINDEYLYLYMSKEDLATLKEESIENGIMNEDGTSKYLVTESQKRETLHKLVDLTFKEMGKDAIFRNGFASLDIYNRARDLTLELCRIYCQANNIVV